MDSHHIFILISQNEATWANVPQSVDASVPTTWSDNKVWSSRGGASMGEVAVQGSLLEGLAAPAPGYRQESH